MKFLRTSCVIATALLVGTPAWADIPLAGISEASGPGATAGTSFRDGYLLAIDEVNQHGGILGQKLALTQYNIETSPEAATEAAQKAVAQKPFAILGPVFSGLTLASMQQTGSSGIPQFTGGEAASLTRKFHPGLLRTTLSQPGSAPRLGALVSYGLAAKRVGLVTIDNEFGRDGKAALESALKRRATPIVLETTVKPKQTDFAAVANDIKGANVDALVLYITEAEIAGLLKALKAVGFDRPIVSDGLVAAQKVIEQAGPAVEGVLAHANISVDAPSPAVQGFVTRYTSRYGTRPDQNALKGFFAVQAIKAGVEQAGKVDAAAFLKLVKDERLDNKRFPDLMGPVRYDYFGDLNRESYYLVVRGGKPQILATIRTTEGGSVELPSGKQVTLDSNEFRGELRSRLTVAQDAPAMRTR